MTINLLIYGIYKSIVEKKNMFPKIIEEIDFKCSIFGREGVKISSKCDEDLEDEQTWYFSFLIKNKILIFAD